MKFLEIGKFDRPSLTHGMSECHQIFTLTRQVAGLVGWQVLPRLLCNWGKFCAKFGKTLKFAEFGVP